MDRVATVQKIFSVLEQDLRAKNGVVNAGALLREDFALDYSRSRGPESGVYNGRENVRAFWQRFSEVFDSIEAFELEVFELEGLVVRVGGFRAQGLSSGVTSEATGCTVWQFEGDLPVHATLFQSREDALAFISADSVDSGQ